MKNETQEWISRSLRLMGMVSMGDMGLGWLITDELCSLAIKI